MNKTRLNDEGRNLVMSDFIIEQEKIIWTMKYCLA